MPLTYAGPRGKDEYNTFVFNDDSMKINFSYILQQLDDYFSPKKMWFSSDIILFCINSTKDTVLIILLPYWRSSVRNVNFRICRIFAYDMIVTGITDNHLRQRLLREPILTCHSALKLGHACEEDKNTR